MIKASDHLGLVGRHAKAYLKRGERFGWTYEDLFQEGVIGLMRAIERFDPAKGFAFSTYAGYWISAEIARAILNRGATVRVPISKQEKRKKNDERPTPAMSSLDAPVLEDGGNLHDVIPADITPADEDYAESEERAIVRRVLDSMRGTKKIWKKDVVLTEREWSVVHARFYEGLTLEQVGERDGVTRERIRQIQVKALAKIRIRLEAVL